MIPSGLEDDDHIDLLVGDVDEEPLQGRAASVTSDRFQAATFLG
jgi:hypothetical protein